MMETTFQFSGRDSQSQFLVFLIVMGAGALPLPLLISGFGFKDAAISSVVFAVLVTIGLRASIVVSTAGVVITRSWFFVPYRWYTGAEIEDVWFGGDWGLPDGASGLVVKLDGREIHIGSAKTMHSLYEALLPLRRRLAHEAEAP